MTARRKFIAGNWKMNLALAESAALAREVREALSGVTGRVDVAVAPTTVALPAVSEVLKGSGIGLAGQNCHWEASGAFTGEVSAAMLKSAGATHVILGHSERRQLFGETDETVSRKLGAVLAQGLVAIVCVGETLAERDAGKTLGVVERQVEAGLRGCSKEQLAGVVVAYEPVWAIGTGRNATAAQAQEVHSHIRSLLERQFGAAPAQAMRIQYGGSVKPDNASELLHMPDIDGALVGGASLKAKDFVSIVRAAAT